MKRYLSKTESSKLKDKLQGKDDINAKVAAFSTDGKQVAFVANDWRDDKNVHVIDVATGDEIQTLIGHLDTVRTLAFSPDGRHVASGSSGRTVKVWDNATGDIIKTLAGYSDELLDLTFSQDGKQLVAASENTLKVWDVAAGHEIMALNYKNYYPVVALSPIRKQVAIGGLDFMNVLAIDTGHKTRMIDKCCDRVNALAFSPDGQMVASGSKDNTVKLYALSPDYEEKLDDFPDARTISPDGRESLGYKLKTV